MAHLIPTTNRKLLPMKRERGPLTLRSLPQLGEPPEPSVWEQRVGKAWEGNGGRLRETGPGCVSVAGMPATDGTVGSACVCVASEFRAGWCRQCALCRLRPWARRPGHWKRLPGSPVRPLHQHRAGAAAALTMVVAASSEAASLAPHGNPCLALPLWVVTAGLWASVAASVNWVQCLSERPHDSEA